MTTYHWIGGSSSYGIAQNWSPIPPSYPDNGDSVVFDGANAYTVETDGLGLTLDGFSIVDPQATIVVTGDSTLVTVSTLTMSGGALDIQFASGGGEFWVGASATLTGGTINLAGNSALAFENPPYPFITTLGPGLTVNCLSKDYIYADGLVNQGTINAVRSGADLFIDEVVGGFVNQGAMNVAGDHASIEIQSYTIENDAAINVRANGALNMTFNNFTNNGAILIENAKCVANGYLPISAENFVNNGNITVDGGDLDLSSTFNIVWHAIINGSGSLDILGGGVIKTWGAGYLNQNVTFQGVGTLLAYSSLGSDIVGFSAGDRIGFNWLTFAEGDKIVWQSASNGVQTFAVEDLSNNVLTTVNFVGQYSASSFKIAQDAARHVEIRSAALPLATYAPDDFNGDGRSDVLWVNSNGVLQSWLSRGSIGLDVATVGVAVDGWRTAGIGDFNGDGQADILWRNANGAIGLWNSSAPGPYPYSYAGLGVADSSWHIAGVGDFNGDGQADVLWRNDNGAIALWDSGPSYAYTSLGMADTSWQIAGIGDFNGDGHADVLWRNSNGAVASWESDGSGGYAYATIGSLDSNWQIAGVGDFNGDGVSDILLRNINGQVGVWDSRTLGSYVYEAVGVQNSSWQVAEVGDFYDNGQFDIMWRNAGSGAVQLWKSDGSGGFTNTDWGVVPTSWTVQA